MSALVRLSLLYLACLTGYVAPAANRHKRTIQSVQAAGPWKSPINYVMTSSLDAFQKQGIQAALKLWADQTCLKFTDKTATCETDGTTCGDYIKISSTGAFNADIGHRKGVHNVFLGKATDDLLQQTIKTAHEIGHVLGLLHEQVRQDRNAYVDVIWANIPNTASNNQTKAYEIRSYDTTNLSLPFDYGSTQMYSVRMATTDPTKDSLIPKNLNYRGSMGQRYELSFLDVNQVNIFHCANVCATSAGFCQNGGYRNPNNCNVCLCPLGLGGAQCTEPNEGSKTCSGDIKLVPGVAYNVTSAKYPNKFDMGTFCNWRVTGPAATTIDTAIVDLVLPCSSTGVACHDFVEVKPNAADYRPGGFKYCCNLTAQGQAVLQTPSSIKSVSNSMLLRFGGLKSSYKGFKAQLTVTNQPTFSVICTTSGQNCSNFLSIPVQCKNADKINVVYTPVSSHCSSIKAVFKVDGGANVTSAPLAYFGGAATLPKSASATLVIPVASKDHNVTIGAIGVPGGCNTGHLVSWGGSASVECVWTTTNFPAPVTV